MAALEKKSIVFVCLGNICRSPIAEAIFIQLAKEHGVEDVWVIDSAAMGPWHVGNQPDKRARKTLEKHNVPTTCRARLVTQSDFTEFKYIIAMDMNNLRDLNEIKPKNATAEILMLGDYDPQGEKIVHDPYYERDESAFEVCYQHCLRCCKELFKELNK